MKLGRKENVSQFYIYLNVAAKEMAPVGAFSVIVKLCLDRLQLLRMSRSWQRSAKASPAQMLVTDYVLLSLLGFYTPIYGKL